MVKVARRSWLFPLVGLGIGFLGRFIPLIGLLSLVMLALGLTALVRSYIAIAKGNKGLIGHVIVGTLCNLPLLLVLVLLTIALLTAGRL